MKVLPALIAAVGLLAACASRPTVEPVVLEPVPEFEVSFSEEPDQQAIEDLPQYAAPDAAVESQYEIEMRIVYGPRDEVAEFFGPAVDSSDAWETSWPGVNKKIVEIQRRRLKVLAVPSITAANGQEGVLAVTPQVSYASGFRGVYGMQNGLQAVERHPNEIGNELASCMIGLMATEVDDSTMYLSLDLKLLDQTQPMPEKEMDAGGRPVLVKSPFLYSKHLQCQGKLSEGKILVVTGMTEDELVYVVLIRPTRKPVQDEQQ
ncbi:MAG: hypothetical protein H6840_00940 [Planctomycetes bacterium]|nr:hypothetical protein [Planctomycetota bacterium]